MKTIFFLILFLVVMKLTTAVILKYIYYPTQVTDYTVCRPIKIIGKDLKPQCPAQSCFPVCIGQIQETRCSKDLFTGKETCNLRCFGLMSSVPCDQYYPVKALLFSTFPF